MKHFTLSTKLFVSIFFLSLTNVLSAKVQELNVTNTTVQAGSEKPTIELLEDPYFYSFNEGKPVQWQTAGTVTQLKGSDRYSRG